MVTKINNLKSELCKPIRGKDDIIDLVLCALLAKGHILLEDIPGVGKTTLATSLAKTMSMNYKRIQFTPDVLPSDLTGFTMYDKNSETFKFHEGAVSTNLFLADELNRTSPKTQSALLEVMEEGHVSVDGITYELPKPFMVIATQNPIGAAGTQKLPDSQLDRFMVRLSMGYPDHKNAIEVLRGDSRRTISGLQPVLSLDDIIKMQDECEQVHVTDSLLEYAVYLTEETRNPETFMLGLSPRGSIALLKMAKAHAYLNGFDYVTPEDFRDIFIPVANHRVLLSTKAKANGLTVEDALKKAFSMAKLP